MRDRAVTVEEAGAMTTSKGEMLIDRNRERWTDTAARGYHWIWLIIWLIVSYQIYYVCM